MAGREATQSTRNGTAHGDSHQPDLTNGTNDAPNLAGMARVVRELLPRFVNHTDACSKEFADPRIVSFKVVIG